MCYVLFHIVSELIIIYNPVISNVNIQCSSIKNIFGIYKAMKSGAVREKITTR